MHNQLGPAAQQNEQQAITTAPHATDEQVAAGIAAAAALDPILATLQPSEVRAMYVAMAEAGGAPPEQQATGSVELSLRIGQRVRHQDFAGRRVTGVIRGLAVDSENALSAEVVLDEEIVLPPISKHDRELRMHRLQVPAHELTPFDERDELLAELRREGAEVAAEIARLQDRLERAEMALSPYFSNGTLGEAWRRGYRGLPAACQAGSDWAKAYAEGAAMRRDGVSA